ncbi:hypothetical protein QQ045_012539 [Rhodiola kirilowii]
MKSTADYGAIPTTSSTTAATPSTSDISFFSSVQYTAQSAIAMRRPWKDFFAFSSLSRPISYREAMSRIRHNVSHFRINYVMIALFLLFLSLLYHPISMIVFLAVFVGWFFFYFFRDEPVRVWNRTIGDRVVLVVLGVVTVVALVLTSVGLNVLVSLSIAVVLIGLHAAFKSTEDAYLDEESAAEGGLVSVVGGLPLKSSTGYSQF